MHPTMTRLVVLVLATLAKDRGCRPRIMDRKWRRRAQKVLKEMDEKCFCSYHYSGNQPIKGINFILKLVLKLSQLTRGFNCVPTKCRQIWSV